MPFLLLSLLVQSILLLCIPGFSLSPLLLLFKGEAVTRVWEGAGGRLGGETEHCYPAFSSSFSREVDACRDHMCCLVLSLWEEACHLSTPLPLLAGQISPIQHAVLTPHPHSLVSPLPVITITQSSSILLFCMMADL